MTLTKCKLVIRHVISDKRNAYGRSYFRNSRPVTLLMGEKEVRFS
jgi:hypothetical protein